jgi:hypothetical protein
MLVKREVIAVKIESVYNTDPTPDATNAILVETIDPSYEGVRMLPRAPLKSSLGKEQSIHAGNLIKIGFSVEVKGSGTAGTAPEIGVALRGCGLDETIVASTSVTYEPVSDSLESVTVYYYHDGKLQKATGCRGNIEFSFSVDDKVMATFEFTGHDAGDSDVTLLVGTYDSTVPPPFVDVAFATGSYSAVISALNLNLGNEVATPPDANASDGYSEIIIVDRDVTGSFDPEHTLKATEDWIADWKNGTSKNIVTGSIGSTAGNIFALTIPTAYYNDAPGFADRDGLRTLEIPFGAVGDDAAFDLAFT